MKPETARGIRRSVPRRRRARGRPDPSGASVTSAAGWPGGIERTHGALEADPLEGGATRSGWNLEASDGFDPAEFAEFLEADDSPMPVDSAFKERLRQRLWGMVRDNANAITPPPPSRIGDRTPRRPSDPNPKRPR